MQRTVRGAATRCTRDGSAGVTTLVPGRLRLPKRQIVLALACGAMLALAASAHRARAEEATVEGTTLRLQEALDQALAHNKELAAFGYRITEQQGRREQAGLLPNPELNVEIEDAAGSGRFEDFDRPIGRKAVERRLAERDLRVDGRTHEQGRIETGYRSRTVNTRSTATAVSSVTEPAGQRTVRVSMRSDSPRPK